MKRSIKIIYVIVFTAVCCMPLLLMPFFSSDEPVGNEQPAKAPELISDSDLNKNFSDEFNLWFTQSMPFRAEMITAKNKVDSGILGQNANNVIVGRDGWLYTEESAADYIGDTLSSREIHNIAGTVRIMQKYAEQNGCRFVFTVAPDKNTIYPEYMPSGYTGGNITNLQLLEQELAGLNVNYVDLRSMLLRHKENGEELYLRTDTHWNNLAALYSYNEIENALDKEHKTYSGASFEIRNDWVGDLSKMLYPSDPVMCSQYYFDIEYQDYRFVKPKKASMTNDEIMKELMSDKETMDTIIQTRNSKGSGSVYVSRDSFFRSMLPFFTDNYKTTYITRYRDMDLLNIDAAGYDDIIYEMVERKLDTITDTRPGVYAPSVESVSGTELLPDDRNIIKTEKTDNGWLVYGILDKDKVKDDDNIYIALSDGKSKTFYEAFPITECERLSCEKSEYGFSALIRDDDAGADHISVWLSPQ